MRPSTTRPQALQAWSVAALFGSFAGAAASAVALGQDQPQTLQILRNGGFEEDELTFRGEPASSCGGHNNDQWYNQRDLFPDAWLWPGANAPGIYGQASQ